jgi:hypothetical protein
MLVLSLLFFGPFAVFVGFGWLWVSDRGWALPAFLIWSLCGVLFGLLSALWTRPRRPILTPLDWSAPATFAPRDREAWALVQAAAEEVELASSQDLITPDYYFHAATRLATDLAQLYHPKATDPIEAIPIVDLLTAVELAAEDLGRLIREIPGGDLVSLSHWKTAVNAAQLVSRANEFYNYLLPLVQPIQGVVRLGTSKLVAQPAWKNMRENVLRWFFRAYIQRLGRYLIETYSGRLAIGAAGYRRLTRRIPSDAGPAGRSPLTHPLRIALTGSTNPATSQLADQLRHALDSLAQPASPSADKPDLPLLNLPKCEVTTFDGYPSASSRIPFRDDLARRAALDAALRADLLLLLIDPAHHDPSPQLRLLHDWSDHYARQPHLEPPPVLIVLAEPDPASPTPPADTSPTAPTAPNPHADTLRRSLPSNLHPFIVSIDLDAPSSRSVESRLIPAILNAIDRAERAALIRDLHAYAARSKIGRVAQQIGRHGWRAWQGLRKEAVRRFTVRHNPADPHPPTGHPATAADASSPTDPRCP